MEEKIMQIAKKITDGADLVVIKKYSVDVSYAFDKINSITSYDINQVGLRVIKDGRVGVSHTKNMKFDPEALVEKAIKNSKYGPRCFFKIPKKVETKSLELFDKTIADLPIEKMREMASSELDKLKKKEPKAVVSTDISKSISKSSYINTNGTRYEQERTGIGFSIIGSKKEEGDFLDLAEGEYLRKYNEKLFLPTEKVSRLFKWSKDIVKIKKGKYDVYFHPNVFEEILETVLTALNGKNVLLKSSFLKDKLGQEVFDKKITISEDPMLEWGRSSSFIDDEGIVIQKKNLIKNGKVEMFYYDLQTAGKAGTESTGNGWRGFSTQARPSLGNMIIESGEKSEKDIIRGIKNGVYVKETMGGFTNNPFSGDTSLQLHTAFKIEDGKIVGRVKDTMIFFNTFDILKKSLINLSKEKEWVGESLIPGVHFSNISLASSD